ncbi:hypothetical protein M0811_03822 [Anaeramoeba ignava]|uniref:Uncharacterized protein n=1 Tax=Anaeramoeba ignava TaxID=1746090 RepID=A0A9Q0RHK5_ANAIG|nr:hypothetical protein M0811_03822 [Anaeramoeba ignava]
MLSILITFNSIMPQSIYQILIIGSGKTFFQAPYDYNMVLQFLSFELDKVIPEYGVTLCLSQILLAQNFFVYSRKSNSKKQNPLDFFIEISKEKEKEKEKEKIVKILHQKIQSNSPQSKESNETYQINLKWIQENWNVYSHFQFLIENNFDSEKMLILFCRLTDTLKQEDFSQLNFQKMNNLLFSIIHKNPVMIQKTIKNITSMVESGRQPQAFLRFWTNVVFSQISSSNISIRSQNSEIRNYMCYQLFIQQNSLDEKPILVNNLSLKNNAFLNLLSILDSELAQYEGNVYYKSWMLSNIWFIWFLIKFSHFDDKKSQNQLDITVSKINIMIKFAKKLQKFYFLLFPISHLYLQIIENEIPGNDLENPKISKLHSIFIQIWRKSKKETENFVDENKKEIVEVLDVLLTKFKLINEAFGKKLPKEDQNIDEKNDGKEFSQTSHLLIKIVSILTSSSNLRKKENHSQSVEKNPQLEQVKKIKNETKKSSNNETKESQNPLNFERGKSIHFQTIKEFNEIKNRILKKFQILNENLVNFTENFQEFQKFYDKNLLENSPNEERLNGFRIQFFPSLNSLIQDLINYSRLIANLKEKKRESFEWFDNLNEVEKNNFERYLVEKVKIIDSISTKIEDSVNRISRNQILIDNFSDMIKYDFLPNQKSNELSISWLIVLGFILDSSLEFYLEQFNSFLKLKLKDIFSHFFELNQENELIQKHEKWLQNFFSKIDRNIFQKKN